MSELKGPKNAIQTMLIYYYQTLLKMGDKDPRQTIATELASMINLSKEQSEYLIDHIDENSITTTEVIDSLIAILLPYTQKTKALTKQDALLITANLKSLKNNIKK